MDPESFADLALRVIAGEASADERAALERELTANPDRRGEFEQLALVFRTLRNVAPLAEAVRATEPVLPAYRVNELRTAVRQHFGPAAAHTRPLQRVLNGLRWFITAGGLTAMAALVVFLCLANRTIEVGLYKSDVERGLAQPLAAQDVPAAKLITFEQDAPFDAFQNAPLAWYEHAKVWVDNEHDQIHIVKRLGHGQVVSEIQPLAPTDEAQRAQLQQVVQGLQQ